MKIGENPQRGDAHSAITAARVFVVVYLPHLTGFFSEMEKILNLSLDSLERTVDPDYGRVTLISNACCARIEEALYSRRSRLFDQIVVNNTNLGKIDGLLSASRGALEDVVVVSDCDVLFVNGWLQEVFHVFSVFPEAASVCPVSSPKRFGYESSTTLINAALLRELTIKKRMPQFEFDRLVEGAKNSYEQMRFINGQVSVSRNGFDTGISGGHQCIAFRRDIIRQLPLEPCNQLLAPMADRRYLDNPPDKYGYWRLSTPRVMAYHMGNTYSKWMTELGEIGESRTFPQLPLRPLRRPLIGRLPYWLRRKCGHIIRRLLDRRIASGHARPSQEVPN